MNTTTKKFKKASQRIRDTFPAQDLNCMADNLDDIWQVFNQVNDDESKDAIAVVSEDLRHIAGGGNV